MRKKRVWIMVSCAALAALAVWASAGRRPFRDLDPARIAWAKVRLTPPDRTFPIPDVEELAALLRRTVIHRRDDSYREYSGQGVVFTLELTDGTRTKIMAYAPFLVIDGAGYRTDYAPCEALSSYANRLLRAEDAEALLEEPPALAVTAGDTSQGAALSSWSWTRRGDGGMMEHLEGGTAAEELLSQLETLETGEETLDLRFTERPETIVSIRCWDGGIDGEGEAVLMAGDALPLRMGEHVYEVQARWSGACGSGGTSSYLFRVERIPGP